MDAMQITKDILRVNLQLGDRANQLTAQTALMGSFPEFNSLSVVGIISGIEEQLGVSVDDSEISAEIFETVGSLAGFIEQKLA
jgi:acyl carrier protein